MDLFLIRHGESYNNALEDGSQRVSDPPLTGLGEEQAERVASHLARGGHLDAAERAGRPALDSLYCSPMRRALQTARPIAAALGTAPEVWIDIHEVGGIWLEGKGDLHGMTRDEIRSGFPGVGLPDGVGEQGWWPGGQEAKHAGRGRAIAVAAELKERARRGAESGETPERLGIVTHGDFMSGLVKALTDQLPSLGLSYNHRNTGITRFCLGPDLCAVRYLNRCEHL